MWQHKQEERELKRTEGDIIKNQRALRKEMRDFENGECMNAYHLVLLFATKIICGSTSKRSEH